MPSFDPPGLEQTANHKDRIPFWNVNVPPEDWTEECPEFLKEVDQFDQAQLAVPNSEYTRMSWEDVCLIINENKLEQFKRTPLDLRNYRKYMGQIKQEYGSVMNFIMQERVRWHDLKAVGKPFERDEDIRILLNDWPYGLDERIVHMVVWVKFTFEEDPNTGDLTPKSRAQIESYVSKVFTQPMKDASRVRWFKNWAALKSVHAVEHFHVMLFDPDPEFVHKITNNDMALAEKVKSKTVIE